jgi:hypothetical protein
MHQRLSLNSFSAKTVIIMRDISSFLESSRKKDERETNVANINSQSFVLTIHVFQMLGRHSVVHAWNSSVSFLSLNFQALLSRVEQRSNVFSVTHSSCPSKNRDLIMNRMSTAAETQQWQRERMFQRLNSMRNRESIFVLVPSNRRRDINIARKKQRKRTHVFCVDTRSDCKMQRKKGQWKLLLEKKKGSYEYTPLRFQRSNCITLYTVIEGREYKTFERKDDSFQREREGLTSLSCWMYILLVQVSSCWERVDHSIRVVIIIFFFGGSSLLYSIQCQVNTWKSVLFSHELQWSALETQQPHDSLSLIPFTCSWERDSLWRFSLSRNCFAFLRSLSEVNSSSEKREETTTSQGNWNYSTSCVE